MRLHPILLPVALASLAGCAAGPDYKVPKAELPARWEGAAAADAPQAPDTWWTLFGDPELSSLVGRAAGANLDVRQAVLRVAEARAERDLATPARWPTLSASAGAERQRISEKTAPASLLASEASGRAAGVGGTAGPAAGFPNPFNQAQYGFDATWEIDLFGRVRRSVEAADAQARATEEESHAALVTLAGEVARTYVDLRMTQARRAITLQAIGTLGARLELARESRASGYGTDADVAQAGALEAAARAQIPDLDRAVALDINRLSLLLALEPGALRGELGGERPIPPVPPELPAGIPSDLLRRRPDIRLAEERLHAATARIGVATADLYPRLTLTAGAGYQAERGADLADWAARYASVGPALELPIFDSGRRRANIRLEDARARGAAVAYAQAVLGAVHEVENALAACREGRLRQAALSEAAAADRDALGVAGQRYAAGLTAYGDILAAERVSQEADLALAQGAAALSTDVVMLCKALGGGWSPPPRPSP